MFSWVFFFFCAAVLQTALRCAVRPNSQKSSCLPLDLQGECDALCLHLPFFRRKIYWFSSTSSLWLSLFSSPNASESSFTCSNDVLFEVFTLYLLPSRHCRIPRDVSVMMPSPVLFFFEFWRSTGLLCLHHDELLQEITACSAA